MKNFKEAVDNLIASELKGPKKTYNMVRFGALLSKLKDFMPLENDQIESIFKQLDRENQEIITSDVIAELLMNLSEVFMHSERELDPEMDLSSSCSLQNGNDKVPRSSLTYDKNTKKFRPSLARACNGAEDDPRKIDYEFIQTMNIQKLADLKHLMQLVVGDSTELTIAASSFRKAMEDLRLSVTIEEVETITELIKEKNERVSIQLMSRVIGEIEKRIMNWVVEEGEEAETTRSIFIQDLQGVDLSLNKVELNLAKVEENEEEENDKESGIDFQELSSFSEMEKLFLFPLTAILNEINEAKLGDHSKIEQNFLLYYQSLTSFLTKIDSMTNKAAGLLRKLLAKVELMKSRIASLEADALRDASVIETLVKENEGLVWRFEKSEKEGVYGNLNENIRSFEAELRIKEKEISKRDEKIAKMEENTENLAREIENLTKRLNGSFDDSNLMMILEEKDTQFQKVQREMRNIERELDKTKEELHSKQKENSPKIKDLYFRPSETFEIPEFSPIGHSAGLSQKLSIFSGRQSIRNQQLPPNKGSSNNESEENKGEFKEDLSFEERMSRHRFVSPSIMKGLDDSDDIFFFARDYLDILSKPDLTQTLKGFGEFPRKGEVFSESMLVFNQNNSKEKRVMLITKEAFYNIQPKSHKVIRRIPLEKITRLTVVENSALLCAIHVSNEFDYLVESFKRADFIVFLFKVIKAKKLKPPKLVYQDGFIIKEPNERKRQVGSGSSNGNVPLSGMCKNSLYCGLLYRLESNFLFGRSFKEYFGVLYPFGLLLFRKPEDKNNGVLIGIDGAGIIENLKENHGKKCSIALVYSGKKKREVLGFESEIAKAGWMKPLRELKRQEKHKKIPSSNTC